jgi:hypothetical protein
VLKQRKFAPLSNCSGQHKSKDQGHNPSKGRQRHRGSAKFFDELCSYIRQTANETYPLIKETEKKEGKRLQFFKFPASTGWWVTARIKQKN